MYRFRKEQGVPSGLIVQQIMSVVQIKLASHDFPLPKSQLDARSIAILSTRLLLDLSPTTSQARNLERELIRSHLRVVYSVHANREIVVSGSSPEPLIAEAAAQIMNWRIDNGAAYMNVWDLLLEYVNKGLWGQGDIGELIGRTLSILAMDAAINNRKETTELKYQTPIPVNAYYAALLTPEAWNILRNACPANSRNVEYPNKRFEDAFKNAYLHFSHYARANDGTPLNTKYGWALWLRGTAVLCQLNQELTDRAIPIYFPDAGCISPVSMSYILDQDKAGTTADPRIIPVQSAEDLDVFSESTSLPYIAGVHCYAREGNEGIKVPSPPHYEFKSDVRQAPRYQFDISGLDSYRFPNQATKAVIRSMINKTKSYLISNHPREYGRAAVRQLQPFLTGEQETSAWFGGFKK